MPKNKIDYSKTIIYKIVCCDLNIKDCYVGHTTDFNRRKREHKSRCNNTNDDSHKYRFMRENGGWDNWEMILYEKFECVDKLEARKRERECVGLLNATLNTETAYSSQEEKRLIQNEGNARYRNKYPEKQKQYVEQNKEKLKEYHKKYREAHKEESKVYMKEYYSKKMREINK